MRPSEFDKAQPARTCGRLLACIIAFNEADRIADCVRCVAFCDEVLVIDPGSTGATVEITRRNRGAA